MINEKLKKEFWAGNSYSDNLYFSSDLSEINVKTGIDVLRMSFNLEDFESFDRMMKKLYPICMGYGLKRGNFERKKVYKNNSDIIEVIYDSKSDNNFIKDIVLLVLPKPSNESMEKLSLILSDLHIFPIINKIELFWDFYCPYPFQLWDFLKRHLFLKFQRSPSRRYRNSFYTNNIRRSVKGIRLYLRPKKSDSKKCVRLELEIHRSIIKKLDLYFPIPDYKLDFEYSKYFDFRRIDFSKLYKYLIRQNREQIR